jgi:D-alanyl-D-alanine dipeptidase
MPAMTAETAPDFGARLGRAAAAAAAAGLDALVIGPSQDLVYLTGYEPLPLERLTALVVRADASPVLVVPELERPGALLAPGASMVETTGWRDGEDPYREVARIVGPATHRVAVGDQLWASHLLRLERGLADAEFESAGPLLGALRARKDPGEIAALSRAGAAADAAFDRLLAEGLGGRTEREVAASLAALLVDAGHRTADFTIVASGPNGASPHHEPGDRRIADGDVVVLDFGGKLDGYCSDMTRTVSVGEPSAEVKETHRIVREAQQKAFEVIRPGTTGEEADRAAREVIEAAGFGDAFFHRTGHGIGLDVHEEPYLVAGNDRPLETGNCFSIEPGIYLEGRYGVRIEDIVALTGDGARRLNEAPRGLLVVG